MGQRFTARYAAVTATLALVVALSGAAYAVNTVRSADIVDGTIRSEDIGGSQVATSDIQNETILAQDVAASSLGRSSRLWAHIGVGGTLGANQGVTGAAPVSGGVVDVTFRRTVGNCAVSVTPFTSSPSYATYGVTGSLVTVRTFNSAGTAAGFPFDVIAVC